eukprot:scaffold21571_cov42-Cyclotella_meneghiniana.AAC.1
MPTWIGAGEDLGVVDGEGLDAKVWVAVFVSLVEAVGGTFNTPEKRHGSCSDGESPMSLSAFVNMLYQWCRDLRNPYKVLLSSQ